MREILSGLLELLPRLCEMLSRLVGLLPRLAEVVPCLAELGGGSVIVKSTHADLLSLSIARALPHADASRPLPAGEISSVMFVTQPPSRDGSEIICHQQEQA